MIFQMKTSKSRSRYFFRFFHTFTILEHLALKNNKVILIRVNKSNRNAIWDLGHKEKMLDLKKLKEKTVKLIKKGSNAYCSTCFLYFSDKETKWAKKVKQLRNFLPVTRPDKTSGGGGGGGLILFSVTGNDQMYY